MGTIDMDDTTFTSDAAAAAGMNRRMLLEQLAAIRSLMHGEDASDDDDSDVIKEAMMRRKEQVAKNLSTEILLTVLLDILLLRLLDEGGEGQATVPPTVSSNQQQRLMDDAAAKKKKKKKKAAAKKKRRKRNNKAAAAKHKKTKLMSWLGGGMISLIMMMVAFSSIATPIFTLSLIHPGDGSGDANAKALPPSASSSLRQGDHGSNNAASTSSPGIISPLTAVVPPPIFSPPVDTAAAVVSVSSHHMKSDELRTSTCLDTPNWKDMYGNGCDASRCDYPDEDAGDMGPATENCCICGGGSHTLPRNNSPKPTISPTISATPTQFCLDTPNWKDKDGDGCDAYERNNWCSNADNYAGEMGPATENCCICGGGSHTLPPTNSPKPTISPTISANPTLFCLDTPNWEDKLGYVCDDYERYNWCDCADEEAGDMGPATENCCICGGGSHTLPPTNSPKPTISPTIPKPSISPTISANPTQFCFDTPNWKDIRGYGCDDFERNNWCSNADDWAGEMGPATENCCYCGKGPCVDTPNWNDGAHGCAWYEENDSQGCPKYGELFGEKVMGFAKDHCCYCSNLAVVALVTPSPPPSISISPSLSVSPTSSLCTDTEGWYDYEGYNCGWYEVMDDPGCPRYGHILGGDAYYADPTSRGTANDHCCHCKSAIVSTDSPTKAPSSSSTSAVCVDTPEWKSKNGFGCDHYERYYDPGCPDTDKYAGEMGPASENCCHCHRSCEDFMAKCQEDTIIYFPDNDGLRSVCKEAESSCCEVAVADHNVKIVTNVPMRTNETVGLYHECKCDFWLRLCEDLRGGEACDFAAEYCCGDYKYKRVDLVYTNSPTCYCDFFNYAQNEFGHKLKTKVLNVTEEIRNPCGQVKNRIQAFIDINGADGLRGVERSSLEAIYNETYGQNWTNNAGWMNETVGHCEWHGIACDGDGFVTSIDLRDNNLAGQFPVYSRNEIDGTHYLESDWENTKYGLANLFYLKTLDLADNNLTGTIDYRPLYNLFSLTHFDISGNQLNGKVDALVTPSLTYVDLSNNNFTSIHRFGKYKGSSQTLRFCDVSSNLIQIDATDLLEHIPPNMEQFLASNNQITGNLPESLNNVPKLRQFDMSSNALSGSLPGFTESFATLQELVLSEQKDGSHFSGSIPENIWRSLLLEKLNLNGNRLTGSIPSLVGKLAVLEEFDLSNNILIDSIPSEFGMLVGSLKQLILANNEFTGSIPTEIGQLQGASVLLQKNNFYNSSKPAPLSLCKLRSGVKEFDLVNDTELCPIERNALVDFYDSAKGSEWTNVIKNNTPWLDEYESCCGWYGVTCDDDMNHVIELNLANNGLSGRLSASIGKLTFIEKLDLSDNDIKGSIPNEIGELSSLTYLRLSYNAFIGRAPEGLSYLTNLQLLQLQSNRITEMPHITDLDDSVYSKSTFVTDCGVPSAFDEAMECDNCTMCCNANEDCYPQVDNRVEKWGFSYGTVASVLLAGFVAVCCVVVLSFYIFNKRKNRGNAGSKSTKRRVVEDEKYALKRIGKDSVYSYLVTEKKRGWLVAFVALGIQVWLLVFFVIASETNLQDDKTDIEFTWQCPRDSDICKDKSDLSSAGWAVFSLLMIAHLAKDMINGSQLIYHSSKVRHPIRSRIRYFISGVCLCSITLFALYVATVYNKAIATSNTDIIVNSVEILFIMDLDEWLFAGLEAWNENWTKHASDSEDTSLGVEAEKGGEMAELKNEVALQKDQVARQNDEIAILRETVQKMQASIAAFSSSESVPPCSANVSLNAYSVESEENTCLDAVAGDVETMHLLKDDNSNQRGQVTVPQSNSESSMPRDAEQENEESQMGVATSDCEIAFKC